MYPNLLLKQDKSFRTAKESSIFIHVRIVSRLQLSLFSTPSLQTSSSFTFSPAMFKTKRWSVKWFQALMGDGFQTSRAFMGRQIKSLITIWPARKFHLLWSWSKLIFLSLINEYSKQKNVLSKKNISFKFQAVKEIAY